MVFEKLEVNQEDEVQPFLTFLVTSDGTDTTVSDNKNSTTEKTQSITETSSQYIDLTLGQTMYSRVNFSLMTKEKHAT